MVFEAFFTAGSRKHLENKAIVFFYNPSEGQDNRFSVIFWFVKKKLEKTITSISKKQCGLIKEWEKYHPDWNKSEEETSQYMEICRIIMGGTTDVELEKTRDLILQSIPVTDVSTV